jgi:hypothetical protein
MRLIEKLPDGIAMPLVGLIPAVGVAVVLAFLVGTGYLIWQAVLWLFSFIEPWVFGTLGPWLGGWLGYFGWTIVPIIFGVFIAYTLLYAMGESFYNEVLK